MTIDHFHIGIGTLLALGWGGSFVFGFSKAMWIDIFAARRKHKRKRDRRTEKRLADSRYSLERRGRFWWVTHEPPDDEGMATESGPFVTRCGALHAWRSYLR